MIPCPYCQKENDELANYCQYCGKALMPEKTIKWYHSGFALIMSFLMFGPFMLPLVWTHPKYDKNKKILITVIIVLVVTILVVVCVGAAKNIKDYYQIFNSTINGTY